MVLGWRLWGIARRRLLWRVRRKLILSYVFIGVVPVVLLVAFFLFAGLLMSLHVSAFLFKRGFDDLVDEATVLAQTAAVEVQRAGLGAGRRGRGAQGGERRDAVPRRLGRAGAAPRRGGRPGRWPVTRAASGGTSTVPKDIPSWVSVGGFGGLLVFSYADAPEEWQVVVRAVAFPEQRDPPFGVVVDIPLDEPVKAWLRESTGITLTGVSVLGAGEAGRPTPARSRENAPEPSTPPAGSTQRWTFNSLTFFDYVDWDTGRTGTVSMGIRVSIGEIYDRLLAAQSRLGRFTLGELFLVVLGVIAVLFLIIEIAALTMGAALARSITGAIHQLFDGTQRVRSGDFSHRIEVRSRDQLGELADSFNQMTASINVLLRQAEEKRRLEEELRIAREIQMSLLPRGPLSLPGVHVSALCVPAREVGGDYYDYFRLDEHRVGLLIADVAGKGTSAALYMAELKGLLLSLSQIYESPKALLVQANQVLAEHLDSRSFITMTYAVLDLRRRTLTYARAGHTPLMHYRRDGEGRHRVDVLAPDGIVLGLGIEGVAARFEQLLQECTLPLDGRGRVRAVHRRHHRGDESRGRPVRRGAAPGTARGDTGTCTPDEIRDRIVSEVEAFAAGADQHDDMTMILLKVDEETGPALSPGRCPPRGAEPMDQTTVIFRTRRTSRPPSFAACSRPRASRRWCRRTCRGPSFPISVAAVGEVRVSVRADDADEARQVIESFRERQPTGPAQILPWRDGLTALEERLEYRFRSRALLERALTHRSRANEDQSGETSDNESLEFLGDAILGFVVADALFQRFPAFDEGEKSKVKASIVSAQSLGRIADRLGLGEHLLLGKGEEKTGGRQKPALLADACEALFAAVYLDGGLEAARALILREVEPALDGLQHPGTSRRSRETSSRRSRNACRPSSCPCHGTGLSGKKVPTTTSGSRSRCGASSACWHAPTGEARRTRSRRRRGSRWRCWTSDRVASRFGDDRGASRARTTQRPRPDPTDVGPARRGAPGLNRFR